VSVQSKVVVYAKKQTAFPWIIIILQQMNQISWHHTSCNRKLTIVMLLHATVRMHKLQCWVRYDSECCVGTNFEGGGGCCDWLQGTVPDCAWTD